MVKTSTSAMVSLACVRAPLGPCAAGVVVWMVLSMVLLFLPSCAGECTGPEPAILDRYGH